MKKNYQAQPISGGDRVSIGALGDDGVMIEVHNNPAETLSDGAQSLPLDQFARVMKKLNAIHAVCKDEGEVS